MIRKAFAAVALCAVAAMAIGAGPVAAEDGKKVAKGSKAQVQQHQGHSGGHRSHSGRNVAAGVAAGVVGAIILNEAARASSSGEGHLSCRQLDRRCDDGQEWACRKLARNC